MQRWAGGLRRELAKGSQVRIKFTDYEEVFEALGRIVYVSAGLGMGVAFESVTVEDQT
jgi:hypothetical protein